MDHLNQVADREEAMIVREVQVVLPGLQEVLIQVVVVLGLQGALIQVEVAPDLQEVLIRAEVVQDRRDLQDRQVPVALRQVVPAQVEEDNPNSTTY